MKASMASGSLPQPAPSWAVTLASRQVWTRTPIAEQPLDQGSARLDLLVEVLGAGGFHTTKGSTCESSVRGKGMETGWVLQLLLGRKCSVPHEEHQAPRAPGWDLQPPT